MEGTSAYARGHAGDNWLTSILRMRNCLGGSVLCTHSEPLVTCAEWNIELYWGKNEPGSCANITETGEQREIKTLLGRLATVATIHQSREQWW